jgi:hypothetical protein
MFHVAIICTGTYTNSRYRIASSCEADRSSDADYKLDTKSFDEA